MAAAKNNDDVVNSAIWIGGGLLALVLWMRQKKGSTGGSSSGGGGFTGGSVSPSGYFAPASNPLSSLANGLSAALKGGFGGSGASSQASKSASSAASLDPNSAAQYAAFLKTPQGQEYSSLNNYFGDSAEATALTNDLGNGMTINDAANAEGEAPREVIAGLLGPNVSAATIDNLTQDIPTIDQSSDEFLSLPAMNGLTQAETNLFYSADPTLGMRSPADVLAAGNFGLAPIGDTSTDGGDLSVLTPATDLGPVSSNPAGGFNLGSLLDSLTGSNNVSVADYSAPSYNGGQDVTVASNDSSGGYGGGDNSGGGSDGSDGNDGSGGDSSYG
jgi:hypothetical protein